EREGRHQEAPGQEDQEPDPQVAPQHCEPPRLELTALARNRLKPLWRRHVRGHGTLLAPGIETKKGAGESPAPSITSFWRPYAGITQIRFRRSAACWPPSQLGSPRAPAVPARVDYIVTCLARNGMEPILHPRRRWRLPNRHPQTLAELLVPSLPHVLATHDV